MLAGPEARPTNLFMILREPAAHEGWGEGGNGLFASSSKMNLTHLKLDTSDLRRLFPLEVSDGLSPDEMQTLFASLQKWQWRKAAKLDMLPPLLRYYFLKAYMARGFCH
jgi:hypothetical protein